MVKIACLVAGFKTCGIHPLNRKALKAVPTFSSGSDQEVVDDTATTSNGSSENTSVQMVNQLRTTGSIQSKQVPDEEEEDLSPELELLYKRRFEESYNLSIDPRYNHWLKKHPELSITDQPSHSGYVEPAINSVMDAVVDTSSDYFEPVVQIFSNFKITDQFFRNFQISGR